MIDRHMVLGLFFGALICSPLIYSMWAAEQPVEVEVDPHPELRLEGCDLNFNMRQWRGVVEHNGVIWIAGPRDGKINAYRLPCGGTNEDRLR